MRKAACRILRGTSRALVLALARRAVVLALAITGLAFMPGPWWFDWAHYMHHVYLALCLAALPPLWWLRSRKWALAALAGILVNAWYVGPLYWPASNRAAKGDKPNLRVFSANVYYGNCLRGRLMRVIAETNPDIVCLQEFYPTEWPKEVAQLKQAYPYCTAFPADNKREEPESIVFSRFESQILDSVRLRPESIFIQTRLRTRVNGRWIVVYACHLIPVNRDNRRAVSEAELETLAEKFRAEKDPIVAAGDFNQPFYSPRLRRCERNSGLVNAHRGFGVMTSYPIGADWFGLPIDHVLVSPRTKLVRCQVGPDIGSDHRPIVCDLCIQGEN